jgi:RNA polymerase sigma-70 factor (ECF subfamily)
MNAILGGATQLDQSEQYLLACLKDKNIQAIERIFRSYAQALYFHARKMIKHQQDAQDIVSDTFLKFTERSHNFDSLNGIQGFLYITTTNACLNYNRKRKNNRVDTIPLDDLAELPDESIRNSQIQSELYNELHQAIARLPPKRQQILRALILEGASIREVAQELGLSETTISTSKNKAIVFFRELLENNQLFRMILAFLR